MSPLTAAELLEKDLPDKWVCVSDVKRNDRLALTECASSPPEYAQLFAALIARTAKDVDVLIDSLPSEESTAALQVSKRASRRCCPHRHVLTTGGRQGTQRYTIEHHIGCVQWRTHFPPLEQVSMLGKSGLESCLVTLGFPFCVSTTAHPSIHPSITHHHHHHHHHHG